MRFLFLLFVIVPVLEMWVLIKVGSVIGAGKTILLVLLTALLGAWLLRQQGVNTLFRVNQRINAGQLPAQEIFEGVFLAVGGALLLTPGFVTDAFGFFCLIPVCRRALIAHMLKSGSWIVSQQQTQFRQPHQDSRPQSGHDVIDGEYTRDD